jgi:hypothetical protein
VGNRYVIIIGIAEHSVHTPSDPRDSDPSWPWLPGVKKDRERFRRTLKDNADSRGVEEFVCLPDDKATHDEIIATLRELANRVKATDQVVVYFAGHGACLPNPVTKVDDYYLIPYDATVDTVETMGISTKELGDILQGSGAEELILILDCCHGGGVVGRLAFQWNESTLDAMCAGWRHFYAMAAASGHQEVIDGNGSFFAQALCDALEGLGVSPNANGLITAGRAFDHAAEESKREAKEYARRFRLHHDQDAVPAGNGHLLPLTRPERPRPGPASSPPDRNRAVMLEKVRKIWIEDILKKNLYQQVQIHLNLSERLAAVFHRIDLFVQTRDREEQPLPEGLSIVGVFDETDPARTSQSLLIQGKPGSGKTFLLLELLEELLDRARRDPAHPTPVVFLLSSWAEKRQPLDEWLADELNRNYGVSRKLAPTWVKENRVLPLLDGLDEVKGECRRACVEAINTFRRKRGLLPLVVCCRTADYDAIPTMLEGFGGQGLRITIANPG